MIWGSLFQRTHSSYKISHRDFYSRLTGRHSFENLAYWTLRCHEQVSSVFSRKQNSPVHVVAWQNKRTADDVLAWWTAEFLFYSGCHFIPGWRWKHSWQGITICNLLLSFTNFTKTLPFTPVFDTISHSLCWLLTARGTSVVFHFFSGFTQRELLVWSDSNSSNS